MLLALDLVEPVLSSRPGCVAILPTAEDLLQRARAAAVPVIFTIGRREDLVVHPALAPRDSEPVVRSSADKFYGTALEALLRERSARVLCLFGMAAHGAVLYTAFAACARGFTVVVAEDAICAHDPKGVEVARWQLLHQPGFANPENEPLRVGAVTLLSAAEITFGRPP